MSGGRSVACALLAAAIPSGLAAQAPAAEGVVMQRALSQSLAQAIAEGAQADCRARGIATAVVVVDRAGDPLVVLRDESRTTLFADLARRKAYTASQFRRSTLEFRQRLEDDPTLAAQRDVPDILALGGGVPIQVGNDVIGGVGSAGANPETSDACVRAGIATVADLLNETN